MTANLIKIKREITERNNDLACSPQIDPDSLP
jgi:hypothetical protein